MQRKPRLSAIETHKVVDLKRDSIFNYVIPTEGGYTLTHSLAFYSERYDKWVFVDAGDFTDGATGALDIDSFGWVFHDELCRTGKFADGTKCNNLQASAILSDILDGENRWFRTYSWFLATWLFGGGQARKNGLW